MALDITLEVKLTHIFNNYINIEGLMMMVMLLISWRRNS